ncbi:unnamed protein product [Leptidea sinapis]|uniref:La-related protein 7 n=1 Tax=Leptidea sinapis TaxID=189913 RepID=A0A5E4R8P3_9NEOP|nr:unnamed protein product [Leptidea sinapis]
MSESENAEVVDQENKQQPRKRIRHRKKQLYENILKQMEFYFSDANLSKDRYLGDLVNVDPYVHLTEFLKFNKIRTMTQDITDIAKAMKHSTFLELSEDKQKVKRKIPMVPYDADLRTIYVESIPVTASREWLERVFSDYGQVAYISLPKFKNSQKIKGFGFIEFTKQQDAQKCINAFTEMGCRLPICMPPEELSSIKMFSNEEKADEKEEKDHEPPKKKSKKNKEKKLQKNLELKLGTESDSEKRIDTPTPTEENKSITSEINTPDITIFERDSTVEEHKGTDKESKDDTSQDESKTLETHRKKRVKKRSNKEKMKSKSIYNHEAPKGALWGLQVLSKSEWKTLRNKYLNLQRKYMKELKNNLHKQKRYAGMPVPAAPSIELDRANRGLEMDTVKAPLEKISGVFVKEVLQEPCLDVKHTKRTIKTNIHVQHIEVKEGQTEVTIRFDSPKAADEYCSNSGNRARVLCGTEEEDQWRRAEHARTVKRLRGREKLLNKSQARSASGMIAPASPQPTHTHIRFDDE